jgi:hypothetical protein
MSKQLGKNTAGNHSMTNQQTPPQYKHEQPLELCDKCNYRSEAIGGVRVREKWYCAKCWVKFLNRK